MPSIVRMPEVLANTGEAVIQSWLVTVGQEISIGDPIAEIETEKAVVEYTAEVAGVLARLIVEPGAKTAVGEPIAVVAAPGEGIDDIQAAATPDSDPGAPVIEKGVAAADMDAGAASVQDPPQADGGRLFATPLVRKIAREKGIDLTAVSGSGPNGRIVRRDLDRLSTGEPAPAPVSDSAVTKSRDVQGSFAEIPLTGMRRAIARRLTESKATVPHFYLTADCRVDALLEMRRAVNEAGAIKVSVNDFVLKAVAGALMEVPAANSIWRGDSIRRFNAADIAVAVAVEGGLLTPVLRGVERLPVSEVAMQMADLAERARHGKVKQQELEGGSFSVSNLGMHGVREFAAILNPPHSGILAVGAAVQKPVVIDGELSVGTMMTVTLSADHRVIDGAVGAQWMAAFVRRIENPLAILI